MLKTGGVEQLLADKGFIGKYIRLLNAIDFAIAGNDEKRSLAVDLEGLFRQAGEIMGFESVFAISRVSGTEAYEYQYEWCEKPEYAVPVNLKRIYTADCPVSGLLDNTELFYESLGAGSGYIAKRMALRGIKTLMLKPVRVSGKLCGLIGFACFSGKREADISDGVFTEMMVMPAAACMLAEINEDMEHSSKKILHAIMDNLLCYAYVVDAETFKLIYVNKQIKSIVGHEPKMGNYCYKELYCGKYAGRCPFCPIQAGVDGMTRKEFYNSFYDRWVDAYATKIKWIGNNDVYLLSGIDVTDKKRYEKYLVETAYIDPITGTNNRASFIKRVADLDYEMHKPGCEDFGAFIMFDIDDFKSINDTFGQTRGDALLKMLADYFASLVPKEAVYRYGGDEFVLLAKLVSPSQAEALIRTVFKRIKRPFHTEGLNITCNLHASMLMYPGHGESKSEILANIDYAITASKKSRKGSVLRFDNVLWAKVRYRNRIYDKLERALKARSFEMYYQPIYNVREERFIYAEALLRLNDAELGNISPAEFIPIAEETGLINEMGDMVFDMVFGEVARLEKMNANFRRINVNVSPIQLTQEDFLPKVCALMDKHGIDPRHIQFEVTESALVNSMADTRRIIDKLTERKATFAIDDFGVGYSALSYLVELPMSTLKLDVSIVKGIETNEKSRTMVRSIVSMSHELGMEVVAEGAETAEQVRVIKELGCMVMQGFYFSRPVTVRDMEALFCEKENGG